MIETGTVRPFRNISKTPFHANWHCLELQRIHSLEPPPGDLLARLGNSQRAAEGRLTREPVD